MSASNTSTDIFRLVSICDAATGQDLVFDPQPLCISLDRGPKNAIIRLQNGPQAPLRLSLTSDQPWLSVDQTTLDLAAGDVADLCLTVRPDGAGEFAVLQLAWRGSSGDFAEHVLVQRLRTPPKPAVPQMPAAIPKSSRPPTGTTELPDWMR